MTKRKKFILGAGLAVASTTVVLAVSCGSGSSSQPNRQLDKLAKQRIFTVSQNSVYKPTAFPYEQSASFGSSNGSDLTSTEVRLVSLRNVGQPVFDSEEKRNATTGQVESTAVKVLKPTLWSYHLDGADEVVLEMKDGSTKVFDSDDAEVEPKPTIDNKYYVSAWERATSANPKSINSEAFNKALTEAKKLSYRVRDNIYWVDKDGKKTQYKMQGDDYYVGYMRTLLYGYDIRRANGGSAAIDAEARKLLVTPGDTYGDKIYPNSYLLTAYGINDAKIRDKNTFITKKDSRDFVNFETTGEKPRLDLMFIYETTANEWSPAPSAFIKDRTAKNEEIISPQTNLTPSQLKEVSDKIKTATGLAKETGYYWYGVNLDSTLFAGKYYYNKFDTTTNKLILLRNENYWDKKFLDDPTTLLRIEIQYQRTEISADLYLQQLFNGYQAGDISTFTFRDQPANNQLIVRQNPQSFGLTYSQITNKNNTSAIKIVYWNLIPGQASAENKDNPPGTNDVYEKLMWNATSDEITNGTLKSGTALKASTSGFGLAFRSILSAAVNWNEIVNLSVTTPHRPWIVGLAQDALIGGSDQETSKFKTPVDAYQMLNTLYAVDDQGNRISLTGVKNNEITPEENTAILSSGGSVAKTRSAGFEELKAAMKKLLDKFYKENPSFANKKIQFTIRNQSLAISESEIQAQKAGVALYNSLDPRIDVKYENLTEQTAFNKAWLAARRSQFRAGWGYDYEGIGSGFDAISWGQGLMPILALAATDETYQKSIIKEFPAIVRAAKKFKEYTDKLPVKLSIPLADWSKLTAQEVSQLGARFLGTDHLVDGKLVPITDEKQKHPNGGAISAIFWLNYQVQTTNEELLELAKELKVMFGPSFNDREKIPVSSFTEIVKNPNYILPTTFGTWLPYADFRIAKKTK